MFKSLFSKIMASYIVIPILILIALFVVLPYNLQNYLAQKKKEELVKNGQEISEVLADETKINVNRVLSSFAESLETNLAIINHQGEIINYSRGLPGMLNSNMKSPMMNSDDKGGMMNSMQKMHSNHGMRWQGEENSVSAQFQNLIGLEDELNRVLGGENVTFRGQSHMLETAIIAVGIPINNQSQQALFLISPLHDFKNAINNIRMLTLQVVAGAILLSLILGYFISKGITEPVAQMKDKVNQITAGDFSTQLDELPNDELGELGRNFNYMSNRLEENLAELATEKNRMQEMLTSMTEGVLGVAATGEVMIVNSIVKDILDLEQQINGMHFSQAMPVSLIDLIENVLANKEEQEIEFEIADQIVVAQAAPVQESDGGLWGIIILVSDVTEIRKLDQMRRLFVANVSHELKTPLTAIQGYLEAILDGVVESEKMEEEYLQRVLKETDRMSRLVADVLDLAQLQSEQFEFDLEEVRLKELIESICKNLENRLGQRKVEINIAQDLIVRADWDKLEEVVINLLSNAIKFTTIDGSIEITARQNQNQVVVDIIDDGLGIPKSELEYIWDRFHQVDRARKPDQQGTGLGLAIVKEIIEGMNGQIEVTSTAGVGSKFSFSLAAVSDGGLEHDERTK
ncbi:MAG: HAMP domain-containing sensor histidine kinase [Bacillota bacterium]